MKLNKVGRFCTSILIISIVLGVTIQNPDFPVAKITSILGMDNPSLDDFKEINPTLEDFKAQYTPLGISQPPAPPPRTGFQLRELVEDLIAVTTNMTDTDEDGLPNAVETVIGTNWNNSDSDFDRITDYNEIWSDLDPLVKDSNQDGLQDYDEVSAVEDRDVDGDGIANGWDFDNDNDGVPDNLDLSPFTSSDTSESFHFELHTNGNPLYVSFQLRPENPMHLQLINQVWDWPFDKEGLMRDQDGSQADVQVYPFLKLSLPADMLPDQADMRDYGISIVDNSMNVPLTAIKEYGTNVALTGKLFYPATSTQQTLTVDAQLFWRVIGQTDYPAKALRAQNGENVSISSENTLVATSNDLLTSETFQWIELDDNQVALKAANDRYVIVPENMNTVIATATEPGKWGAFEVIKNGTKIILKAQNDQYVSISQGVLVTSSDSIAAEPFDVIDVGYKSDPITLALYDEAFKLTGFLAEEHYGITLGTFASTNRNQTIATGLALGFDYLPNATTHLAAMPARLIAQYNVSVSSNIRAFSHRDEGFLELVLNMAPTALGSLPPAPFQPLITVVEDRVTKLDLKQVMASPSAAGNGWKVNLAAEPMVTSRIMKMDAYNTAHPDNTSRYTLLTDQELQSEVQSWGLEKQAILSLMALMQAWNTGIQTISQNGELVVEYETPDPSVLQNTIKWIGKGRLFLASAIWINAVIDTMAAPAAGLSKALAGAAVVICAVQIGLLFYQLSEILGNPDYTVQEQMIAGLYIQIEILYTGLITMIGLIPYVGWAIVLAITLSDLLGESKGWSQDMKDWIIEEMTDTRQLTEFDLRVISSNITLEDPDQNRLDVGDRIIYNSTVVEELTITEHGDWDALRSSYINAMYRSWVPSESYSITESFKQHISTTPASEAEETLIRTTESYMGVTIVPGIGMPNFPVHISLSADYQLVYEFGVWQFGWRWTPEYVTDTMEGAPMTLFFDVMPGTISDFARWRGITALDNDRDGLLNHEEDSEYGTHPWRWDTDADGLNDKFEVDLGTDPTQWDTDEDGLLDWFEFVYGTDATQRDTDFDGLPDYVELAGWMIAFNYSGHEFTIPVHSDPLLPDTEEDGLDDQLEYLSNLNPRSSDTDGDGNTDLNEAVPSLIIHSFPHEGDIPDVSPHNIAVDPNDDTFWIAEPGNDRLMKYAPSGTLLETWDGVGEFEQFRAPYAVAVGPNDGSVYVADTGTDVAANPQKLTAPQDMFLGISVALTPDGDTLIAGTLSGTAGAAYVFTRTGDTWTLQARLTSSDGCVGFEQCGYAGEKFGWSVAINAAGNLAVIGAPFSFYGYDLGKMSDRGAAYIFTRTGDAWTERQKLATPDFSSMYFGQSVTLNAAGDTLVVGAKFHEGGAGAAYVFEWDGTTASQQQKLIALNGTGRSFGSSVALNTAGDILVVGAPNGMDGGEDTYIFTRSGTTWSQEAILFASDGTVGDEFGDSVAINAAGDTVVVGTKFANASYIFTRTEGEWIQQQKLNVAGSTMNARVTVAIDAAGDTLVLGAPGNNPIYVYERTGEIWSRRAMLTLPEYSGIPSYKTSTGPAVAINAAGDIIIGTDPWNTNTPGHGACFVFEASAADRLQKFASNGTLLAALSLGFGSQIAWDLAVGPEGDVYVSYYDGEVRNILQYASNGTLVRIFGEDQLERPWGLAVDPNDGSVYVADHTANRIVKFDSKGTFINSLDSALDHPTGVAVDKDGYIYVTSYASQGRIHMFEPREQMFITTDDYVSWPRDIAIDTEGTLYTAEDNHLGKYTHQMEYLHLDILDPDADYDDDGLANKDEIAGWEVTFTNSTTTETLHVTSNPLLRDSDFDGLFDFLEYNETTNPRDPDTDDDGKSDYAEWKGFSPKTNPNHFDTDADGLEDTTELTFGSAPTMSDTEGDGLLDLEEFYLNSNPASNDTDGDGLFDAQELRFNSSLLSPDTDGDFMFDGMEKSLNTNPRNPDTDGDALPDGIELLYNTNPMIIDSDGDHVPDGIEVDQHLNPLNPDTDGDAIADGIEIEQGTNPRSSDTDGDGISDLMDLDSVQNVIDHVILAFDPSTEADQFAVTLAQYTNVTVVSSEELVTYAEAPYIVLVGQPDGTGPVGVQLRELLADTGEVLRQMEDSNAYRLAVRHGVWTPTQTVVLLSRPYISDHLRVLNLLSQQTVTIQPDSARLEYHGSLLVATRGLEEGYIVSLAVDEIDTVRETDSALWATFTEEEVYPQVELRRYNASTISHTLTLDSGLEESEEAMDKYFTVIMNEKEQNTSVKSLEATEIRLYYTGADLDRTGDGKGHHPGDLDEEALSLFYYDETLGNWSKLSAEWEWVLETGVNTNNVELYGRHYEGYAWAIVSHLSTFGMASTLIIDLTPPELSALADPVLYEEGTVGHNISWIGGDRYPGSYELYRDLERIDTGSWENGTLTWNVDGLPIGTYNFTLVVWDLANHSVTGVVELTVYNTPTGKNITVTDPTTAINITFSEVTHLGTTYITISDVEPESPTLFNVVGSYYMITTTATYTGPIMIVLPYNETQATSGSESFLQLYHWDPGTKDWTRITTDVDSTNKLIYGETTTLSIFVVTEFIIPIGLLWWIIPPILLLSVLLLWRRRRKRPK